MNNFTKTEALPKTGHVNEVCKEWLVREDGALAYKLQSQEINDFYKGNRFRNAVVREDFPTALHEQIKEKENAEKQAEEYRRHLIEQEQHDKRVAKEIADKLELDIQEQQQRELIESEMIAQQMQEIYVNLPPVPPPAARDKHKPPPRPAKASTLQQNSLDASSSNGRYHKYPNHYQSQQQQQQNQTIQLQQQHFSNTNGYVGLSMPMNAAHNTNINQMLVSDKSPITTPQKQQTPQQQPQQQFNQFVERSKTGRTPPALTIDNFIQHQPQQYQHRHQHSSSTISATSSTSSSASTSAATAIASSSATRRNVFDFINTPQTTKSPLTPHTPHLPQSPSPKHALLHTPITPQVDELIEYSDVADSIRRYDINSNVDAIDSTSPFHSTAQLKNINKKLSPSNENLLDQKFQKLSPEKYDQLVGNNSNNNQRNAAAAVERHMQQHADDIELYVDPCDYASLKEIGLPMEEIKEMSKKLKQEQKDELLARQLQELEAGDGLTQEERDRLLAIEAQDKELAKMLQEREKAKAKRAKEKARLRKSQQKESSASTTLCSTSNGLHCGPLLSLPQDCMSSSKHSSTTAAQNAHVGSHNNVQQTHRQHNLDDPLDLEAYSNPIDVLHNQQQRVQNGTLTNGSLTRDHTNANRHVSNLNREDDIYTLPVDSCRPGQRPASLNIGPESNHILPQNSMTRSENYSMESHDSTLSSHDLSPRMNYSKSGSFDQSSSPTPPYMPIQGTRRSNSSEDRKKKSKDKCTHQ
ncbi:basic-leucine zipper transcription factor A isoform X2 [Teleopsis dalmanni]|uniref:basic-leucine zipper transcription factor A isoform X2 n=1 Tax=Teleopsis dalmanni TaxID=139649 RepID=UPI0018CE9CB5|nr:basic-leucine zipper transcription factor A isoform X2 [Teleopsis dalmanni]